MELNTDISVEQLQYWIDRATNVDETDTFGAWDCEYAQDNLNNFMPGLGDYVSLLRRDKPMSDAEFYRKALATLYNVFNLFTFADESLRDQINEVFSFVLDYKKVVAT